MFINTSATLQVAWKSHSAWSGSKDLPTPRPDFDCVRKPALSVRLMPEGIVSRRKHRMELHLAIILKNFLGIGKSQGDSATEG